ncbi:MAG: ABC transporter substrate-binding protein [Acidobacteria bacterium]|nr:ABC transporter substrate-binding protein [Acidobacteriota bacterium]
MLVAGSDTLRLPASAAGLRFHKAALIVLPLVLLLAGCASKPQPAAKVTLALVDRGLFDKEFRDLRDQQYKEFTAQTGIEVKLLPGPESAVEQLKLWQKLLGNGPETLQVQPDVFGIDVIWPGILAGDLLDLKPYVGQDIAAHFPELVANLTVDGRLVALPSRLDVGLLYYRTDLLRRYGYNDPPRTWDELETMAARIQKGERAAGNKDFWGFVWQGAISEALTCDAIEWQASNGGGNIIDPTGKVTVNNEHAIRAWERAARWVGSISPSGVTTYKESDASNIWRAGEAAFMRNWSGAYAVSNSEGSAIQGKHGVTLLPRGRTGAAEVFGGDGYAVSRRSAHPKEAVALVRYLCGRRSQTLQAKVLSTPPTMPDLYNDPELLRASPHIREIRDAVGHGLVARPSTVTGEKYTSVSAAFSTAVHSVLVHEKTGAAAAAELERRLMQIIGTRSASGSQEPSRTARPPHADR